MLHANREGNDSPLLDRNNGTLHIKALIFIPSPEHLVKQLNHLLPLQRVVNGIGLVLRDFGVELIVSNFLE